MTEGEEAILNCLIQKSKKIFPNWKNIMVKPLNDSNMGSLLLCTDEEGIKKDRVLGKMISECVFKDKDGVEVIASLNLDDDGNLYELDIWKTDFSSLIEVPIEELLKMNNLE